jgi:hypothetical protein
LGALSFSKVRGIAPEAYASIGADGPTSAVSSVMPTSQDFFGISPFLSHTEAGICTFEDSITASSTLAILLLLELLQEFLSPSAAPTLAASSEFPVALPISLILVLRTFFPSFGRTLQHFGRLGFLLLCYYIRFRYFGRLSLGFSKSGVA